jgi:hypothetical protein
MIFGRDGSLRIKLVLLVETKSKMLDSEGGD